MIFIKVTLSKIQKKIYFLFTRFPQKVPDVGQPNLVCTVLTEESRRHIGINRAIIESSGVVRFDLGPLVQGQTKIAKPKSAYNSLIVGPTGLGW